MARRYMILQLKLLRWKWISNLNVGEIWKFTNKTLSINRIDIVGISGNDICDRFGKVKYSLEHGETRFVRFANGNWK